MFKAVQLPLATHHNVVENITPEFRMEKRAIISFQKYASYVGHVGHRKVLGEYYRAIDKASYLFLNRQNGKNNLDLNLRAKELAGLGEE